ncbi:MAG: cadherin repeat domain-containing protein [Chroococcales cyanobacterium]
MKQIITVNNLDNPQDADNRFNFDVNYSTSSDSEENENLTGLGLRLHFNSDIISLDGLENLFSEDLIVEDVLPDHDDLDNDSATDQYLALGWVNFDGEWPGSSETGSSETLLYTANFVTSADFTEGETTLNFTASSTANGYSLEADPITIEASGEVATTAPEITSSDSVEIDENTTEILTLETDTEATFTISGGDDADLFTINETTGELSFTDVPDFETPNSASGENQYSLEVTATGNESNLSSQQSLTVTVQDVNEAPMLEESNFSLLESSSNGTVVGTVTASDPEEDEISYSIEGEAFAIDSDSGEITVADATALESQENENVEVTVTASDGDLETSANVNIQVEEAVNDTNFNYDVDGNGQIDALTDGILILRHLFGISGEALTNEALGENPERTNPEEIQNYLDSGTGGIFNEGELQEFSALDVDGNGETDALTDGIVIARLMLGFEGEAVTNGAIAQDSPLADNPLPEIAHFIQGNNFLPTDLDNSVTTF